MDIRSNLTNFFHNNPSPLRDTTHTTNPEPFKTASGSLPQEPISTSSAHLQTPEEKQAMELAITQAINELSQKAQEAAKKYSQKVERTEPNILTAYQGFEQFKRDIQDEYGGIDLSNLDVSLEDGKLKLSSELLTDSQLSRFENNLAENDELSDVLKTMLADITLLARYGPTQGFIIDETSEVSNGALSLNDFINAYNDEFERFHDNGYTVRSDQKLFGIPPDEPVLDHYQVFEERYQREGLERFAWAALEDAAGYSSEKRNISIHA